MTMWLSSTYPIHRSVDKVNRSGADAQVVSCYSVIFHPFVERLTVFYISGLILQPAALLYPPSPPSQYRWHHNVPERYVNYMYICSMAAIQIKRTACGLYSVPVF